MTKNLFLVIALFISANIFSQSFTSIWDTNNTSTDSPINNEVTIPTNPAFTSYNYTVEWGDGAIDNNVNGDITHTYAGPGTYTISISGDFPAIYFNDENASDKLKIIEITDWGTIQWQSMENAFFGCVNLNFDAINAPNLTQVTSLRNMFKDCTSFNGIVNNWDVSNITDISGLFNGCGIFNRPLDNWNTSAVTTMSETFNNCYIFNEPLDSWNTAAVTDMSSLFKGATQFNQNINNWNVSQVTTMESTFDIALSYNYPLNSWNVANVTNMHRMFYRCREFDQPLDNWDVSKVTDMSYMFNGFLDMPFNQPINVWNVSNVTNMSHMFYRCAAFNQPLNNWNVGQVTDMSHMFESARSFNQNIENWNVENVTNMGAMFSGGAQDMVFNQPLNGWDVGAVEDMSQMFKNAVIFNQPLNNWNVSSVLDMSEMFRKANSFNQPIEMWNVGSVTTMQGMFNENTGFDLPLNNWGLTSITNISSMFANADNFNQPLNTWNVDGVTTMASTFSGASSYNQDLTSWNFTSVTNMSNMLSNSGISQENYDNLLIEWAGQTLNSNINLGANNINYCDGLTARQQLIDTNNWNITGDIVNCSFVLCTRIISPYDGDQNVPANSAIRWEATPNADGYRVSIRREDDAGNVLQVIADDEDFGNVLLLTFTNEFLPGDNVFVTVVPYNSEGPALGCQEISFKTVPSWLNSPDAFKITIDTRNLDTNSTNARQYRLDLNDGYPDYLTYDFSVDWGDDQYDNNVNNDITHTYLNPGVYTIAIIGTFPAYFQGSSNRDNLKLISMDQWGMQVWGSMASAFYFCENMVYNATDVPNLSQVTNMQSMFRRTYLFNANINNWDVSNVTNMNSMFYQASIFNQPLNNWNVSNVTSMATMLSAASEFNQDISSWNTSNVTSMSQMFNSARLFNQPLNSWNVDNVTNMEGMFRYTDDFNQALDNWNVDNVTDMEGMFQSATAFNQNIDNWNVSGVTEMASMFSSANDFNQPLNSWNVSSVTDMTAVFSSASSFNQPLDQWNVSAVTNMQTMFSGASAFNQNINTWNVTNVLSMRYMFSYATAFNNPLNTWDVNSVVNMSGMFRGSQSFNQPLDNWEVSAVANMSNMFEDAVVFNQPINIWDVSSVTLMQSMFEDAAVFNQSLANWDVSVVTNFNSMFKNASVYDLPLTTWNTGEALNMEEMFRGAALFNQNIDNWNVSFVTTMEGMFEDAAAYNQTMNSWNVASVATMKNMFKGATLFNEDIGTWNVRGVTTMERMFEEATAFNQNLNNWRVSNVSDMDYMFDGASAYNQPMDLWNLGNVSMRSAFYNATALNQNLGDWDVSGVTNMSDMLDNTALIRENYDNTLIAWSEQTLTNGITLGAQGLPFCDAQEERQSMIDTFGWTFSLDVRDCPIPACSTLASPLNGATDVPVNTNITWEPALFAQGYRLTVGTTSGGNDIVNNETITNETSYEFASDFNTGVTVFVTIIPFNDEGDAVGPCTEESYTISNDPATIPECTTLSEPLNNANDVLVTSDLSWNPIVNADGYRLTVGTSSGANDILNNEDVGNVITYDLATNLPEDSDIFITITPYNDEGDATGCAEEMFDTELIPVPPTCTNLTTPLNNATDVPIDVSLTWNAVSNATGYLVIVGTTSGGIEVVNNIDVGSNTTYDIPTDLQEDRLHYVTIIPYNNEGDATGCIEETFTTGNSTSPPSCTALTAPLNGATAVDPTTNLTWATLTSATGYKLSVGTTSGGTDIFTGDLGDVTTYDLIADLSESTVVYVTITPYNDNGDAIGCTSESFTTDGPPLCTTLITPANLATNVAVDASLEWNTSANTDGYKLTVMASSSTANNLTDFDVTSGTTYDFANDFERGETVTVTIVPYNATGDATGCTSESFTVIPPPVPACTTLMTPVNNAIDVAVDASLEWNASTGADGYKLTVVASSSTANNITDLDIPTGTTYDFVNNFDQGETVSVTIVPYNQQGDAIGCTSETFTIKPVPACNSLIMPTDGAIDVAVDTNMSWTVVSNATGYRLSVVASSSTANNVTNIDIPTGNTYNFLNDFEQGETVTVTITPYNESGDAIGCSSEGWTIKPVPACTNLVTPADGAFDVSVNTDIEWTPIADATGYKLTVVGSTSAANNLTDFDVPTGNTYNFGNDFEQGETVTVTVVPYNEVGDAIGCTSESFTIKPVPTCTNLISPANGTIDVPIDTAIEWASIADADGYKLTVTASTSTANNITDIDVTTGTTYNFTNDFEQGETVAVTITSYNEVGDALGCTSESFTIKSIPVCTNLISPINGEEVAQAYDISWNEVLDADGYKLTISGSSTTINNVTDFDFVGTTYVFPNDFTQGEVVTVTIIPYNEVGDAIGCTSESFTIRPIPNCTNLVLPINNAAEVPVITDISWNASFDADGYRISVGTSPNGSDIVNNEDVASLTSYTFGEDLPSETLIYATIIPYNTSGDAIGCTSESFTTEVIIPDCAVLSSPFNGESDVDLESSISWDEVEKTNGYRLSIGTTPRGTDILNNQDMGTSTSYAHGEEYPFDTEIYVTIIPYNSKGDAAQCEQQSFTTMIPEDDTKYGFSPDGDGINEYWHIENIEYYPENMVTIYNRWGDAVFRIDNYDNGSEVFRGEANLKIKMGAGQLPTGTYFFHIQIEGETILKKTKGYVVIKR